VLAIFENRLRRKAHAFLRWFAVVVIEIPGTADRLGTLHQQAGLHAHLAVEVLHRHADLAAREERRELIRCRDEVCVRRYVGCKTVSG